MADERLDENAENTFRNFTPSRPGDSSEDKPHLTPADEAASVNVPAGEWVDVPAGMVAAVGTYVDDAGVLRSSGDHSVVAWHLGRNFKTNTTLCRRGEPARLKPEELIYDVNGAPWCPECYEDREQERERKKIAAMFQSKVKEN